jgi:hypothetical protein
MLTMFAVIIVVSAALMVGAVSGVYSRLEGFAR